MSCGRGVLPRLEWSAIPVVRSRQHIPLGLFHRDALAAASFRGAAAARLQRRGAAGKGIKSSVGMMAVGCSREEALNLLTETNLHATVACVNSPSNVTISEDVSALEKLRSTLAERNVSARRLKVEVVYHSAYMHSCSTEYANSVADLEPLGPVVASGK